MRLVNTMVTVLVLGVTVTPAAADDAAGSRSGEDIYKATCVTCHAAGVAGAPKLGDAAAWKPRMDKGMDTLYTNAIKGLNAMPPKGLCMDCSEEELKTAVDYMVEAGK